VDNSLSFATFRGVPSADIANGKWACSDHGEIGDSVGKGVADIEEGAMSPVLTSDGLLTADEVAARLNVSVRTVNDLRRRRELPCVKVSARVIRFRLEDVSAFIGLRTVKAAPAAGGRGGR